VTHKLGLLTIFLLPALHATDPMLFVYFKEPANMGVFFATSNDSYRWQPLNKGKPWLPIEHAGELMRDPFITRGPDHEFHMVWTWAWRGQSIGYAHSPDLVHWSEQREIPLMAGTPGTKNTWAPEIYWDASKSKWLIIWSSTIDGLQEGNRIYSAMTADFITFSQPKIFFDPGYMVIDATILETGGKYYLVFKDERLEPLHKWIGIAESENLEGPYTNISDPLTESWSEGPSAAVVGKDYIIYYDHYRDPKRYEAVRSRDLKHWTPINDEIQFPAACKHGSFLKITPKEKERLEAAHGAVR
jgi:beta-xylosidase